MPKNICIYSDGTGQKGGKGHNSNVFKLYQMSEKSDKQVCFYDPGLGTNWQKITGLGFGLGISKNIKQCYQFIVENYEAGDSIFDFGFSRGSTTARSLAGFIDLFGVLPSADLIDKAYKIYRVSDRAKREQKAKAFTGKHRTTRAGVRFIGVWDTVAALGGPFKSVSALLNWVPFFKSDFHDLRLSGCVEYGCHALAIDEERRAFAPAVWDPDPRVTQVWFAGVHTDIGGGYTESGLSDITLDWMLDNAIECGLKVHTGHGIVIEPDPDGTMHDSRAGVGRLYRKRVRSHRAPGKPEVHPSALKRKNYHPWILSCN